MLSRRQSRSKRRKRFRCNNPRGNTGHEILCQERAERLIFPGLDISRRPVVEQAEAGDMARSFIDWNRMTPGIAGANPDAELQFNVEPPAWSESRLRFVGVFGLAARTRHRCTRYSHRRCASV